MPNANRPKAESVTAPAKTSAGLTSAGLTSKGAGTVKKAAPAKTVTTAKTEPTASTAPGQKPPGKPPSRVTATLSATEKTAAAKPASAKAPPSNGAAKKASLPKPPAKAPMTTATASKAAGPASTPDLKDTVTQTAKPAAKTRSKPAPGVETQAAPPPPAPRKAMSNAAATQALMASAAASKEAAARNAAKAAAEKAAAEAAAAAPPPPPVQTISPPIASRPGMSRPGMPGMRPAFSITPRMPMGALRSGGMAEAQAGAPKAPPVKVDFRTGDMVVYPTHGVGTVQGIEDVNVAGISLQVITVTFEENRMTLRVPTNKAASAGLRKLAGPALVKQSLDTLKGRARIKRTMWSRRAQEYEAKINSGDPVAIAEVVRDLFRNAGQPDQSFSERQIYEQALDRLAMEFAAIEKTDKPTAIERLIAHMRSAEKPGAKPIEEPIEEE